MRAAPKVGEVSDAVFPEPDEPRPTYEQARARLVEVVQALESGSVPLSTSMELWQEAEVLARTCQEWLDGARAKLDEAVARDRGAQPSS